MVLSHEVVDPSLTLPDGVAVLVLTLRHGVAYNTVDASDSGVPTPSPPLTVSSVSAAPPVDDPGGVSSIAILVLSS